MNEKLDEKYSEALSRVLVATAATDLRDGRRPRFSRRSRNVIAGIVAVFLLGAGASGAAWGIASQNRILNAAETATEFEEQLKEFPETIPDNALADEGSASIGDTLPEGVSWPSELPAGFVGHNMANESGLTTTYLAYYWYCSWEVEYFDAIQSSDSVAQDVALSRIESFPDIPIVKTNIPDYQVMYDIYIEPAKNGDTTDLETEVTKCRAMTGPYTK